jgi:hypothetical protein
VEQHAPRGELGSIAGELLERMWNALVADDPARFDVLVVGDASDP